MSKKLDKKLRSAQPRVELPSDFTDSVMSHVRELKRPARWRFGSIKQVVTFAAVAVALVVATFVGLGTVENEYANENEVVTAENEQNVQDVQTQQETIENTQQGSEDQTLQRTQLQPTTLAEAQQEAVALVSEIESELTLIEADLGFSDDLLSDAALFD